MKNKSLRLMVLGMVVVLALLVFVPVASASMVTKVMYAQENVEVFEWTATSNGSLYVKVDWLDHFGAASSFPVSEVDAGIIGPKGAVGNDYVDFDVKTLYSGVNGNSGTQTVVAGKKYYICVFPWVDDCTATVTMKIGGSGGTNITATRMSDGATVTSPQTVATNAADGEVYLPSAGDWISTFQAWPGTAAEYYTCWNDYVYERVAGSTYDTLSEVYAMIWYQTPLGLQAPARATVNAGGNQGPRSSKWYALDPQIWPAAAVPNVVDAGGNVKPGAVAATKSPAWYTYAYEDSSVTTQKPGYFWAPNTTTSASKRSHSISTATGASISAKFHGTSIRWFYTMGRGYGRANVSIDGGAPTLVSQYNAGGFLYKQSTNFPGLANTDHTITITNAGIDPAGSTNSTVSHDKFEAQGWGETSDPTPYMENNYDGMTSYGWGTASGTNFDGGSHCIDTATNAAVAFEFKGDSIRWTYTKGRGYGTANVYIDGVFKQKVSLFNSTGFLYKQGTTFGGLADTTHIILIVAAGIDPAGSTNSTLSVDSFVVTGSGAGTFQN